MVPQSPLHQNRTADLQSLVVPRQTELMLQPEGSITKKCDALLQVCERSVQLQDEFLRDTAAPRTDFELYKAVLREIRSTSSESSEPPSSKTPEAVALDLIILASAYLSTELSREQSHFWIGVTSALTAATRLTMPDLNERLISARSILVGGHSHTPTKARDLDE